MFNELFNNPLSFLGWLIALVVGITVHEFSHAYMADRLGDPTPRVQGRLTLNPLAHLDPLGTLMILIARFGWGKPVQFDVYNLKNPQRDTALISIAGPISNILVATIAAILLRVLLASRLLLVDGTVATTILTLGFLLLPPIIMLNVGLAVFNLVPIHPLDGFKIVQGILPAELARQWAELEPYGMIFLIFLVFPIFGSVAPLSQITGPIINFLLNILLPTMGNTGVL